MAAPVSHEKPNTPKLEKSMIYKFITQSVKYPEGAP